MVEGAGGGSTDVDLGPGRLKGGEGSIDLIAIGIIAEITATTIRVDLIETESVIATPTGTVAHLTTADTLRLRHQTMIDAITMKDAPATTVATTTMTPSATTIKAETEPAIAPLP